MKTTRLHLHIATLILCCCACAGKPDDVLDKKDAVSLLTDLRIAQAMFDTGQGDRTGFKTKKEAESAVLKAHGISPEEYRKTLEWYGANLDKYDDVNKDVNKRITEMLKKADPNASSVVTGENNIWPYADHLMLTPLSSSEGISLSIGDPQIEKGGYTELKAKTNYENTNLTVLLGVEYEDGSMSYTGRSISGYPQIKVRVQTDTGRTVRRLYGYMRPATPLSHVVVLDSISLIKMPYDSLEYFRISSQTTIRK